MKKNKLLLNLLQFIFKLLFIVIFKFYSNFRTNIKALVLIEDKAPAQ